MVTVVRVMEGLWLVMVACHCLGWCGTVSCDGGRGNGEGIVALSAVMKGVWLVVVDNK